MNKCTSKQNQDIEIYQIQVVDFQILVFRFNHLVKWILDFDNPEPKIVRESTIRDSESCQRKMMIGRKNK